MLSRFSFILLISILFPLVGLTQDWAPIGAVWHYTQGTISPNYNTYTTFESIKDTSVEGKSCRLLIKTKRGYTTAPAITKYFMYSDSNRVFYYQVDSSRWCLLYDFGLEPNDTMSLACPQTADGKPLRVSIDSVDSININGQKRKLLYYKGGDLAVDFTGPVIAGIGSWNYMFPTYEDHLEEPLRCYEDNKLGLYRNQYVEPWTGECERIFTSFVPLPKPASLKIYPNPLSGSILTIEVSGERHMISLCNSLGQLIERTCCTTSCSVDLSGYNAGMYYVIIKSDMGVINTEKFIKTGFRH